MTECQIQGLDQGRALVPGATLTSPDLGADCPRPRLDYLFMIRHNTRWFVQSLDPETKVNTVLPGVELEPQCIRRIGPKSIRRRNNLVTLCQLRPAVRLLHYSSLSLRGQFFSSCYPPHCLGLQLP